MVDALKRMDKKFLIIAGMIICLPILIIVFLAIVQSCGNTIITHDKYEEKMISAAEKYIKAKDKTPEEEGDLVKIKLSTLVDGGYIKSSEDLLGDASCKGSVEVRRNGASIESNNGGYLNYTVNLECKEYSTLHLADKIKENVVTEESGLYEVDNKYVFKGDKVKNYMTFFGQTYRIVSIDENNIIKLIKTEAELNMVLWDNKYNIETNKTTGQTIYKDSLMLENLLKDYENVKKISKDAKNKIVAYDACVGKRSMNDYSISNESDCSEILDNQVISLLNVSDYASASLDVNCTSLNARSCNNYNYLYETAVSTWTLNSVTENTYQALAISDGLMEAYDANIRNSYNYVIYIDGNELYTQGTGSLNDPYIIQ